MNVYAAFRSVPDYTAGPAPLLSVHESFEGAVKALYPDREDYQQSFRKWPTKNIWEGPDGFGMVKELEVLP